MSINLEEPSAIQKVESNCSEARTTSSISIDSTILTPGGKQEREKEKERKKKERGWR
jgi:hypothetical protein